MPSDYKDKAKQMRVYSRTPEAKALRAARQVKYRASAKDGIEAIPNLQIDPQALLAALTNWKQT